MNEWFRKFSSKISGLAGTWQAFVLAMLIIVVWFAAGFFVGFTNTFYQLLINTGTTIITFLMVFLIQNTQNRDAKAIHLKVDELIKATRGARNSLIDLDKLSDEQLKRLEEEYKRICTEEDDDDDDGSVLHTIKGELKERELQKQGSRD